MVVGKVGYVYGGGGLANESGSMVIENCTITTNTVSEVQQTGGSVTLWSTVIGLGSSNGITKLNSGTLAMTNCLIHGQPSHGIVVTTGTVSIVNCTIANNGGWGVTNSAGIVSVKNSIAWDNTNGGLFNCTVTYSDYPEAAGGDGNINADPLFEGPATNNYRLRQGSPCINKGINLAWMTGATDLDGEPRINSKTVDMGAYEIQLPPSGTVFMCQ